MALPSYLFVSRFSCEHEIFHLSESRAKSTEKLEYDEELDYKIVGSTEANSLKGKISNESPVGKALIGAKIGDIVEVETQAGVIKYKVLEIERSN